MRSRSCRPTITARWSRTPSRSSGVRRRPFGRYGSWAGKVAVLVDEGRRLLTLPVRVTNESSASIHLRMPTDTDAIAAQRFLTQAAAAFTRLATLQDRHNRLQKLAITDQLTGIYNRR